MGEEIQTSDFSAEDFAHYKSHLEQETALLEQWFKEKRFSSKETVAGFELEAWLVDEHIKPAPINTQFLEKLNNRLASPELAKFNIEINTSPRKLRGHSLTALHNELHQLWTSCRETAATLDADLIMIGILPTVENDVLTLANMSDMTRYRALNREVIRLRKGKPLVLDIQGEEHLRVTHRDLMLEAVATSFQIHFQVAAEFAVRVFNAATVLSAPMVALTANSPFLFGKDLWDETRIPLFEQAVSVGGYDGAVYGPIRRVGFGSGYIRRSLMECFQRNLEHYPILLPVEFDEDPDKLKYLRLHNGTIWRWNRPLIGIEADGSPHLRIEHRVVPAGPSVIDTIANAAFFYGVVTALANEATPVETRLEYNKARDNFYHAARLGLRASIAWLDGSQVPINDILLELLPLAQQGLEQLEVAAPDISEYLNVIRGRLQSGCNGCHWQRAFVSKHGQDMGELSAAYLERQNSGVPVHEWTV